VTDKAEERAKIAFMARYKERLQEAFSTILTQHRETHAKQVGVVATDAGALPSVPHFRLEPLATVYVRHARSYVFLENALDLVLGPAMLDGAFAVGAAGPEDDTLRARIRRTRDLYYGAYILACQDIGLPIALGAFGDPYPDAWDSLATAADAWLLGLSTDPVAAADVRVIIPIADAGEHRTKYWAVIGVRGTLAGYSYIHGTDVSPPPPDQAAQVWLPTEQFLEVVSSDVPLDREEFRALCDEVETAEAIRAALESR
jgi:hypothetical protein